MLPPDTEIMMLKTLCTICAVGAAVSIGVVAHLEKRVTGWRNNHTEALRQRDHVERKHKQLAVLYGEQSDKLRNARNEALESVRERDMIKAKYDESVRALGQSQVVIANLRKNNVRDQKGRFVKVPKPMSILERGGWI